MDWIKTNWTILAALLAMSAAWGQQYNKVENLEQAIIKQAAQDKKVDDMREQYIRQDEKLKNIERSQENTERLLKAILESNRTIEKKVK
jgi:hypothetical protein